MELNQEYEIVGVDSLMPHPKNPRRGDVGVIGESIRTNGFFGSIVAQRSTGRILAGNHRWKAAKAEGVDSVPVVWVDVDDEHAVRILLADNRTNDIAEYDSAALAKLLAELDEACGLAGTGYSAEDLDQLLTDVSPDPEPGQSQEESDAENEALDAVPENVEAKTKAGDVVKLGQHSLHCVDCLDLMRGFEPDSIDAIVTDPPYGIGFMGKGWDASVPGDEFAAEALRVLKPGGHLIAFAATRTVHRLAVAIEDAGFEIRDQIGWLQWQGFPKNLDISKAPDKHLGVERTEVIGTGTGGIVPKDPKAARRTVGGDYREFKIYAPATEEAKTWAGWGTALKPSCEPAVLARKPLEGTAAENVLKWGTGGLNIDATRIAYGDDAWPGPGHDHSGQWDEPISCSVNGPLGSIGGGSAERKRVDISENKPDGRWPANIYYCPKPSRGEREEGCDELARQEPGFGNKSLAGISNTVQGKRLGNAHPTVKPTKLMRWLLRLVTPHNGVVLEPFAGSGTTLVAAEREGFKVIAAELSPEYCDIIRARVESAQSQLK